MRAWVRHSWELIAGGYLFVPGVMIAASIVLALGAVWADRSFVGDQLTDFFYAGTPEGARTLLSTIASSAITVAGVVFSITVAALSQASSQFGPRLLRNFMHDRGNQFVLGMLTSTFVYCLLVVRTVRGTEEHSFVPQSAVTLGVVLALFSIGVLVYFIDHICTGLQAPVVAARAAAELRQAIARAFPQAPRSEHDGDGGPDGDGREAEGGRSPRRASRRGGSGEKQGAEALDAAGAQARADASLAGARAEREVRAPGSGFLQVIDEETLVELAEEHDLRIDVDVRAGHFLVRALTVGRVVSEEPCPDEVMERISGALLVGRAPTAEQDLEFFTNQLVEIACRALSPGINDPFTAMECVNWLGAALVEAARGRPPARWLVDSRGVPRVRRRVSDFAGLVGAAFNPVRQAAERSVPVTMRLLERIADVAEVVREPRQQDALREQVVAIDAALRRLELAAQDRRDVEERRRRALTLLAERERSGFNPGPEV